jgi:NADH oxidase (H2O2-forming)
MKDIVNEKKPVVIVGGGVAGMTLAMYLIRRDADAVVTVVKREAQGSYSPCGIPFALEGKVESLEDVILNPVDFYEDKGIEMKTETEVVGVDLDNRTVTLDNGEELRYDILVIATGRKPFIPPIPGADLKGVHTLSNYGDAIRVDEAMKNAGSAVIIGGGVIGLETAFACASKGIKTTVVEMLPYILPLMLDEDMASIVQHRLEDCEVEIRTSTKVTSIEGDEHVKAVVIDGGRIDADMVVIATGVRPNSDLANKIGLDTGKTGGILVNPHMKVKRQGNVLEDVYTLGDCVEVTSSLTNRSYISAFASTAALQARVVADNICRGNDGFAGYISPAVTVIADLQIGSVGLTSHTAEEAGITPSIGNATGFTRSGYYPGKKKIHIKLLVQEEKLVGAQLISEEDVKERVNYITLAINRGIGIHELKNTERCFTPPLSLLIDPFVRALDDIQ